MNEPCWRASGQVQRAASSILAMIERPGQPAGHLAVTIHQETSMFKTISAALLAVCVIAAPALAADRAGAAAPVSKTAQINPMVRNANAKMAHHRRHFHHHRHHKPMAGLGTHRVAKLSTKHLAPVTKRG